MEDILFSNSQFLIGPTDDFTHGTITFIESINLFIIKTFFRENIIIN
jgi:hypothetical protein